MVQAVGAILVVFGAVAWHIASSGQAGSLSDIWNDFLKVMRGEAI